MQIAQRMSMSLTEFLQLPDLEQELWHSYEEKRRIKILEILDMMLEHKMVTPEVLAMIKLELIR